MNKVESSFYTKSELINIGFKSIGEHVLISRKSSIYGASSMVIGNHVRIDDYTFLSGNIIIENHVHIATFCSLVAGDSMIQMKEYSSLSSKGIVYAVSDDYSGDFLINPTIPMQFRNIIKRKIIFERHSIVGTGCTILPGAHINEGVAVGAMSLVIGETEPWSMYVGIPVKKIKDRSKHVLQLEEEFIGKIEFKNKV